MTLPGSTPMPWKNQTRPIRIKSPAMTKNTILMSSSYLLIGRLSSTHLAGKILIFGGRSVNAAALSFTTNLKRIKVAAATVIAGRCPRSRLQASQASEGMRG
jgi:hypothetical protein